MIEVKDLKKHYILELERSYTYHTSEKSFADNPRTVTEHCTVDTRWSEEDFQKYDKHMYGIARLDFERGFAFIWTKRYTEEGWETDDTMWKIVDKKEVKA